MSDTQGLFVAPDGDGEPTIWREVTRNDEWPTALLRRSAIDGQLWNVLIARLEVRP